MKASREISSIQIKFDLLNRNNSSLNKRFIWFFRSRKNIEDLHNWWYLFKKSYRISWSQYLKSTDDDINVEIDHQKNIRKEYIGVRLRFVECKKKIVEKIRIDFVQLNYNEYTLSKLRVSYHYGNICQVKIFHRENNSNRIRWYILIFKITEYFQIR